VSTALYRRYRSARFADLIGQEHIAQTLLNEVRGGSLAHAYLFAGIRGTGKTSTARILARAINCLQSRDGEPCNQCAACLEILGGGAVDVLEIDAASNRGIDEMRDLRDKVKFLPASLRRKVYIIDEAHMLTTEAWNAFLKTLEEPPPHVLFVLATTEPHKVPDTVRSRVQRFDFRRVDRAAIAAHLAAIAVAEQAAVDAGALELIARAGQGSVRDALSLLDQALASGERPVTVATVRRALGLADPAVVRDLLSALAAADAAGALRAVAAAFDVGADARQLLREASRLARAAELVAVGYPEGTELGEDDQAVVGELAAVTRAGFWVDVLDRFSEAEVNLRQPVDARLTVELAVLRLTHGGGAGSPPPQPSAAAPRTVRPGGAPAPSAPRAPEATAARPSSASPAGPPGPPPSPEPAAELGAAHAPPDLVPPPYPVRHADADAEAQLAAPTSAAAGAPTGPSPADLAGWKARWPAVIEAVNRRDRMLAGVLRSCMPVDGGRGRLSVGAPWGFHGDHLANRLPKLTELVTEFAGEPVVITIEQVDARRQSEPDDGQARSDPGEPAAAAPPDATQAVLDTFPGSVITGSRLRDHAHE
jgi:DNA polymerase III subunit gamma/tau